MRGTATGDAGGRVLRRAAVLCAAPPCGAGGERRVSPALRPGRRTQGAYALQGACAHTTLPRARHRPGRDIMIQRTKTIIWRILLALVGGALIFIGMVFLFLPGPGSPLITLGVAVLALEFERPRRWLKRLRARLAGRSKGRAFEKPRRRLKRLRARLAGRGERQRGDMGAAFGKSEAAGATRWWARAMPGAQKRSVAAAVRRSPADPAPRRGTSQPDVGVVEAQAYDSWPAEESETLGAWRLRFNHGVTRRGNSVFAGGAPGRAAGDAIHYAERWYAERGRPAAFQLSPLSDPELDPLLEARGYHKKAPVRVWTARAEQAAVIEGRAGVEVVCHQALDETWFELSGTRGRFAGKEAAIYRTMLERVSPRACFALAYRRGEPAAVGLGIQGRGLVGIFSMLTLPEHRGFGAGREILREIAHWSIIRGGSFLYLQVEEDNEAAQGLYQGAGFTSLYRYHYRVRNDSPGTEARD